MDADKIKQMRAEAVKQREEAIANANALQGAINAFDAVLAMPAETVDEQAPPAE